MCKKKQNQKHLKKKHAYIEKNTCTAVFIAALFIIKIKCPSTGELIHIHTYTRKMEFYSVIKKITEILSFRETHHLEQTHHFMANRWGNSGNSG